MAGPPQRVERIVERALSCSVRDCEQPTGGRVAETYLLDLDGDPGRAVCKLGGPSVRTGDVIEPLVLELVTETTTVPAPSVLASGHIQTEPTTRWALYEFRDGSLPTPFPAFGEGRFTIVRQIGAMLGEVHATHQFDQTGGLVRDGDELAVERPDGLWIPEQGRRLADRTGCDPGDWQPVLTHGDLFPGNLLATDGDVTAFLDWGNAHVTTAGYALARAEMRFVDWFWRAFSGATREQLRRELHEGYRQYRSLPPDYETLATAYKLLWLGQSVERLGRHTLSSRGRAQLRRHLRGLL
ncbi:Phosphotransferase enzyme family protein [Halovenus aranensis]|uniref:Phosphotransferase enzyme family protein n=1 Tax=Halovenus aranensis TaxID=890420 RepID=A0A1G8XTR5_9EURY|nr:aminoglycoside phosphotransferase family protein [Halovenus aranensis]SDJ93918.1 Phosphotransferase enzyme family protein [Halovenus aranensis]